MVIFKCVQASYSSQRVHPHFPPHFLFNWAEAWTQDYVVLKEAYFSYWVVG